MPITLLHAPPDFQIFLGTCTLHAVAKHVYLCTCGLGSPLGGATVL